MRVSNLSAGRPNPARRGPVAAIVLIAAWGAVLAGAAAAAGPHHRRPAGDAPARVPFDLAPPYWAAPGLYPEIGIVAAPNLEHWPGNYRPDSYRLRGYDGRQKGSHVCRGAHRRTLSSAKRPCPPGQKEAGGARRYSTDAD